MARKGRKLKQGKRTASGRLARDNYPTPIYDRGSERVQAMREQFGTDYNTAIGRAYASGLLGQGDQAKDRYMVGKRLAKVRLRYYAHRRPTCALDNSPRGNVVLIITEDEYEQALLDKAWLKEAEAKIDRGCAPYLDQLLSDLYTDAGPYWLTSLIEAKPGQHDKRDLMVLAAALRALDALIPHRRAGVIRVAC